MSSATVTPIAPGSPPGRSTAPCRDVVRQRLRHHHGVTAGEDVLADPAARALLGPATTAVLGRRGAGTSEALEPGRLVAELEQL